MAATTCPKLPIACIKGYKAVPLNIVRRATPKPAPALTPNTSGPARGFLNRVCINKPETDRAAPAITAVIALGSR